MNWTLRDQTLALAGMFQAAALVKQIARHGQAETSYYQASIASVVRTESDNVIEIFGGLSELRLGIQTLLDQLKGGRDMEVTRYVINFVHLERRLMKKPALLEQVTAGIALAKNQAEHFSPTHENVIANLADLYVQTISTMQPRIMVQGELSYLTAKGNPEKVRTLLFAGIRACVLWRQLGGGRWQLFWQRKKYLAESESLLEQIHQAD